MSREEVVQEHSKRLDLVVLYTLRVSLKAAGGLIFLPLKQADVERCNDILRGPTDKTFICFEVGSFAVSIARSDVEFANLLFDVNGAARTPRKINDMIMEVVSGSFNNKTDAKHSVLVLFKSGRKASFWVEPEKGTDDLTDMDVVSTDLDVNDGNPEDDDAISFMDGDGEIVVIRMPEISFIALPLSAMSKP